MITVAEVGGIFWILNIGLNIYDVEMNVRLGFLVLDVRLYLKFWVINTFGFNHDLTSELSVT